MMSHLMFTDLRAQIRTSGNLKVLNNHTLNGYWLRSLVITPNQFTELDDFKTFTLCAILNLVSTSLMMLYYYVSNNIFVHWNFLWIRLQFLLKISASNDFTLWQRGCFVNPRTEVVVRYVSFGVFYRVDVLDNLLSQSMCIDVYNRDCLGFNWRSWSGPTSVSSPRWRPRYTS